MTGSRKTLVIVLVVAAALLAIYSGWKTFGDTAAARTEAERNATPSGPRNRMSSILGPDANGKPRTEMPASGNAVDQPGTGGMTPMQRMNGAAGGAAPR